MACKCGGKTIRANTPPKKTPPKKALPKNQSARSARLSRKARKAALAKPNPYAKGCKCS